MVKLFLIVFSEIDRDSLTKLFDATPGVHFWFYNLPSSLFVKSTMTANQLQTLIQQKFGESPLMIIVELDEKKTDISGWIPNDHLKYFK